MIANLPKIPTIGAIADLLAVSQQEVDRVIRERGIQPIARAGTARVFSLSAVEEIRREIMNANEEDGSR